MDSLKKLIENLKMPAIERKLPMSLFSHYKWVLGIS